MVDLSIAMLVYQRVNLSSKDWNFTINPMEISMASDHAVLSPGGLKLRRGNRLVM